MIAPLSSPSEAALALVRNVEAPSTRKASPGHSGARSARVAPSDARQVATPEVYAEDGGRGNEWDGDIDLRTHAQAVFEPRLARDARRARALERLQKKFGGQLDVITARDEIGFALDEDFPYDRTSPGRRPIAHAIAAACVSLLGVSLALITAAGGSTELAAWLPSEPVRWLPETAVDAPVLTAAAWGRVSALLEDLARRDHVEADLARRLMATRHIVLAAGVLALGAEGASLAHRPRTARLCELRVLRFVAQRVPQSIGLDANEASRNA